MAYNLSNNLNFGARKLSSEVISGNFQFQLEKKLIINKILQDNLGTSESCSINWFYKYFMLH